MHVVILTTGDNDGSTTGRIWLGNLAVMHYTTNKKLTENLNIRCQLYSLGSVTSGLRGVIPDMLTTREVKWIIKTSAK